MTGEEETYLTLAEENLNTRTTLPRGIRIIQNDGSQASVFVSTRFLDYARNDMDCKNVRLTLAAEKLKHSRNIAAGEKEKRNVRLRAYSGIF